MAQATDASRDLAVVFSLDISGSMRQSDAIAREHFVPGRPLETQTMITRIEAAKYDIRWHYHQLTLTGRKFTFALLLFGETLHVYEPRSLEELWAILDTIELEGSTRTDLALKEANHRFLAHQAGTTFINIVYTDGAPAIPHKTDDEAKTIVAQLLAEGTRTMRSDADRGTTFIQYGTTEYNALSKTSKFLEYLDKCLAGARFNAVDTGKQCMRWRQVNPGIVNRDLEASSRPDGVLEAPWDNRIEDVIKRAICD